MTVHLPTDPAAITPGVAPHARTASPSAGIYRHSMTICLKDSNAYGNTYFCRYFEWQGVCRERWFHDCIDPDMLQAEGVLITRRAEHEFEQETFPFEHIDCELQVAQLKRCSLWLEFRFFSGGRQVGQGRQQIVFANHARQITAFPAHVVDKMRRYATRGGAA